MIGNALRLLRVLHDMTATELAEKLKISTSYLSEIENEKKEPSLELIQKYGKVFGVKASGILHFSETLPPNKGGPLSRENLLKILKLIERGKP